MNQDDTFRTLKKIPYSEMSEKIDIKNFKPPMPPAYQLGDSHASCSMFYNRELYIHHWRIAEFEANGWTFDEFILQTEKNAIILQVNEFNKAHQIPAELISRSREFFPNAKFVHAHVELE